MGGERFYYLAEHENEQEAPLETVGGNGLERTVVEDLSAPLEHMFAEFKLLAVQIHF